MKKRLTNNNKRKNISAEWNSKIWKQRIHQVLSMSSSFSILINMKIMFLFWLIFYEMNTSLCDILQSCVITWDIVKLAIAWTFIDLFEPMITLSIHDRNIWFLTWGLFLIRLRWRWMLGQWKRMFFLFWFNIAHLCSSNSPPLLLWCACIESQFFGQ